VVGDVAWNLKVKEQEKERRQDETNKSFPYHTLGLSLAVSAWKVPSARESAALAACLHLNPFARSVPEFKDTMQLSNAIIALLHPLRRRGITYTRNNKSKILFDASIDT
jgi:hypothetical protein